MVIEIIKETREMFDCELEFTRKKMPGVLLADEMRVKYILLSLIQKASTRNKLNNKFRSRSPVLVNMFLADDDEISLGDYTYYGRRKFRNSAHFVIIVTD